MSKKYINNKFVGKIGNKNASEYYGEINRLTTSTIEEQLNATNKILGTEVINGTEFYDEFWTKVFFQNDEEGYDGGIKLILNKVDDIYSDTNICSTLERMASDILKKDAKKDNPDKMKVYSSVKLFEKATDEQMELTRIAEGSADGRYSMENGVDDIFVLNKQDKYLVKNKRDVETDDLIVLQNQMNYKLEKKIDKIKDHELYGLNEIYKKRFPIVDEYYQAYIKLKDDYKKFTQHPKEQWIDKPKEIQRKYKFKKMKTKEDRIKKKYMIRNVYSLREDFIDCIYAKARFIMFKVPLPDQGCPSWEEYDEKDPSHVRYALQLSKNIDLQNELACIVYDLDETISQCDFTDIQKKVLELYRKDKTQKDIGCILNISQPMVNQHINAIVNKIVDKNWEIYTDWYYLNICHGEYKYCKECKKVHLIHCFSRNKRLKDGYETICKKCYNSKQKR